MTCPGRGFTGFILLLGLVIICQACEFNKNIQGKGEPKLQGVWNEGEVPYQKQLKEYTRHSIKFTCDSFYATFTTFSKNNYFEEECFNGGKWDEFAKGTYLVRNDTLYLNGTFTKSNWKQKISGCYRIGQYIDALQILKSQSDTLLLQSVQSHTPVLLNLKNRITCDPKPID